MEQQGSENLREKLELHKRWLHDRLHSEYQDSNEDYTQETLQSQPTGSFRGNYRDSSEPPLRKEQLFIDEYPEEQEDDEYQNRSHVNYRETTQSSINQKSFSGYGNQRRGSMENSQDQSMEVNGKKPKRWEALYNLNKKNLQIKEQISRELENKELDSECTFQPKIKTSYAHPASLNPLSIHERNRLWKERKDAKVALTRESGKDKDLEQCTFKPHVSPRKKNENFGGVTTFQSRGIEAHLKRQFLARKTKEEKEMILENPLSRLPENVLRKEGKITVPKGPKFVGNTRGFDIASLKKPLNPFQATKQSKATGYAPTHHKRNSMTPLGERNSNLYGEEYYYDEVEDDMHNNTNNGFSQVLQSLHNELHNFELRYE